MRHVQCCCAIIAEPFTEIRLEPEFRPIPVVNAASAIKTPFVLSVDSNQLVLAVALGAGVETRYTTIISLKGSGSIKHERRVALAGQVVGLECF